MTPLMKVFVPLLVILSIAAFSSANSHGIKTFFTPQKFAEHYDDLAMFVPYVSGLHIAFVSDEQHSFSFENIEVLWLDYHHDSLAPPAVSAISDKNFTLVQQSGEITAHFTFSFAPESCSGTCLYTIGALMTSKSLTFNRTFQYKQGKPYTDVRLQIEWNEVQILDLEHLEVDHDLFLSAVNRSVRSSLGKAISDRLIESLNHRYQSQVETWKKESFYFVPHSDLMLELSGEVQISQFSSERIVFTQGCSDPSKSESERFIFDPALSGYQIALTKASIEQLIHLASEHDYFTYLFSKSGTPLTNFTYTLKELDKLVPKLSLRVRSKPESEIVLLCRVERGEEPIVLLFEAENNFKTLQGVNCAFFLKSSSREPLKKVLKFSVGVLISYTLTMDDVRHDTVIRIKDISLDSHLSFEHGTQTTTDAVNILSGWLKEGAASLAGKMVQLGSQFSLPIQNPEVYVKNDHLLLVGEPLSQSRNYSAQEYISQLISNMDILIE